MTDRQARPPLESSFVEQAVAACRTYGAVGGIIILSASLSACGSDPAIAEPPPQPAFTCSTADGTIVPEDYCDDDGDGRGGLFYVHSGYHGSPGYGRHVPRGTRFAPYSQRGSIGAPSRGALTPPRAPSVSSSGSKGGIGSGSTSSGSSSSGAGS